VKMGMMGLMRDLNFFEWVCMNGLRDRCLWRDWLARGGFEIDL